MRTMWTQMKEEEEMGFLLIDARNAFNEANQTKMLWTIRQLGTVHIQLLPPPRNIVSLVS